MTSHSNALRSDCTICGERIVLTSSNAFAARCRRTCVVCVRLRTDIVAHPVRGDQSRACPRAPGACIRTNRHSTIYTYSIRPTVRSSGLVSSRALVCLHKTIESACAASARYKQTNTLAGEFQLTPHYKTKHNEKSSAGAIRMHMYI